MILRGTLREEQALAWPATLGVPALQAIRLDFASRWQSLCSADTDEALRSEAWAGRVAAAFDGLAALEV
jgi:hypothetical protein